jgi:hypothetical protein
MLYDVPTVQERQDMLLRLDKAIHLTLLEAAPVACVWSPSFRKLTGPLIRFSEACLKLRKAIAACHAENQP